MKSLHVLDVLESDGGWLTAAGVAARTEASDTATQRTLYRLRNDGKVETRIVDGRNEWRYVEGAHEEETPMEKRCSRCKETKPANEFGNNKRSKDGLSYYCKACMKARYEEKKQKGTTAEKSAPPQGAPRQVELNGWRATFSNPTLDQLEKLRELVGVSTLDEAAAISKAIAGTG